MENYHEYLAELKSTTIFQDITDADLLALLQAMQPKILCRKKGSAIFDKEPKHLTFQILLRSSANKTIAPRRFKYDMPKWGEPGFLMGEIPALSQFIAYLPKDRKPLFTPKPLEHDLDTLEVSADMLLADYGAQVKEAQQTMLRNLLGILAQKVMDVRHELFLLRDGRDIYA